MDNNDNLKGKLATDDNFSFDSSKLNFGNSSNSEPLREEPKNIEKSPEELMADYIENDVNFNAFIDYYTIMYCLEGLNSDSAVNIHQCYSSFNGIYKVQLPVGPAEVYLKEIINPALDKLTDNGVITEIEKLFRHTLESINERIPEMNNLVNVLLHFIEFIFDEKNSFEASKYTLGDPITKLGLLKVIKDTSTNADLSEVINAVTGQAKNHDKEESSSETIEKNVDHNEVKPVSQKKGGIGKIIIVVVLLIGSLIVGYFVIESNKQKQLIEAYNSFDKKYLQSPNPSSSMGYGIQHDNYTIYATPYVFGGLTEKEHQKNAKIYIDIEIDANEDINNYDVNHVCIKSFQLDVEPNSSWKNFNTSGIRFASDKENISAVISDKGTIVINGTVNAYSRTRRKRTINLNNVTLNALSNLSPDPTWEETEKFREQFRIKGPIGTLYENASTSEIKALEEKRKRAIEIEDSLIHDAFINLDAKTRAKVALMGKEESRAYLKELIN